MDSYEKALRAVDPEAATQMDSEDFYRGLTIVLGTSAIIFFGYHAYEYDGICRALFNLGLVLIALAAICNGIRWIGRTF
jgi:hypothetical protein